jgi:hypothetical protein
MSSDGYVTIELSDEGALRMLEERQIMLDFIRRMGHLWDGCESERVIRADEAITEARAILDHIERGRG